MKIAVYLSGVPRKTKTEFKREILTRFAHGAKLAGDEVYLVDDYTVIDCDLAVIQGWIGFKKSPHLTLRADVINHQRKNKKHLMIMDSNLFGFLEPDNFNRYLRYSLGDVFPDNGYYFDSDIDPTRWESIKQQYNFVEKDWNISGQNILITLQRNGGWSMGAVTVQKWLDTIVPMIRNYSRRPIVIRPHPGNIEILETLRIPKVKNISISHETDIRTDLTNAWATVTYNSSPSTASLLWGVPTWVTDPNTIRSQAGPWANTDLSQIETPARPDRSHFYNKLAQCHFSGEELDNGVAWQFMRQRLPNI